LGKTLRNITRFQPEESDIFLCIGTESLFFGSFLIYPPAAYIITGLLFLGIAYILANPKTSINTPVAG
jgi:hypothetical protein